MDEELRHADLQDGSGFGDVRVADDHVHAAVCTGVSQCLVAGVDDGARACRRGRDGIPHLISALGELQTRSGRSSVDPAVAHQDLTGHEERDEGVCDMAKVAASVQEIVFVAAVGVALRIQVVTEEMQTQIRAKL